MMMARQTRGQEQLFHEFSLDEVVPADHLVRRIDAVLNTSWVHQEREIYREGQVITPIGGFAYSPPILAGRVENRTRQAIRREG